MGNLIPETIQTMSAMLTEPVFFNTPLGLIKIPEPIMDPYEKLKIQYINTL